MGTRRLPADLVAVALLTFTTVALVFGDFPGFDQTPLRIGLGMVFVLFFPGYALVAILFPEAGESPIDTANGDQRLDREASVHGERSPAIGIFVNRMNRTRIDSLERVALSFGLSIAVVPLIALGLELLSLGIRGTYIIPAVAVFTLVCTAIAVPRRWNTSPEARFAVPFRRWMRTARVSIFDPDDRAAAVLNVALALSILLALGSIGYAVTAPPEGEQFTEFSVLTEDDGELVADGYPEEMARGESANIVVGISNNEYSDEEYTVVVQLQKLESNRDEARVLERDELDRFSLAVEHNETRYREHTLSPTMVGKDMRVMYLLYKGDAPAEPTKENSYRSLHIWIDVEDS